MFKLLNMPKLSPTMESGIIAKWHKKVGDKVKVDELLCEVMTDKATMEYRALDEGWVRHLFAQEGEEVAIQQPLLILGSDVEESLGDFLANLQNKVSPVQTVVDIESQDVFEKSPSASFPTPVFRNDQPLFRPFPLPPVEPSRQQSSFPRRASPLARALAREKHLSLDSVVGTGPNGRIVARDLAQAVPTNEVSLFPSQPSSQAAGSYELKNLSPNRRAIARRMQATKSRVPHFYVSHSISCGALMKLREQLKEGQLNVSINDLIVRATSFALRTHPALNCGFDEESESLIAFRTIDLSVVVQVEDGVMTPIVRQADSKSIGELVRELRDLTGRAKAGKLSPHEFQGGSFTISNLGMYGISQFQAIINVPQGAILSIGGMQERPVVEKGSVVAGHVLELTVAADHRILDGVEVARFLRTLEWWLERPALLLLHAVDGNKV